MSDINGSNDEFAALQTVIAALQPLEPDARRRIFDSVGTFLQIGITRTSGTTQSAMQEPVRPSYPPFSADLDLSPKQFVLEKQPRTDVERIAVLAYYLTHYQGLAHFKTLDLSKLNTDAAQPKFSNAANTATNAVKLGYLVASTKGARQLSAAGEQFVAALPDREAARAAMAAARPKRKASKRTTSSAKRTMAPGSA
jgi:hypothetical protein